MTNFVAHSLRGEGFDASEDGTGRGIPLVCDTLTSNGDAHSGFRDEKGLIAFNITPSNSNKDYNARESDRAQALTAGGNYPSARGGDLIAGVTIHGTNGTANAASMTDLAGSLRTKPPGSVENSSTTAALHGSAVRRLTPLECERLQGFPDGYTDVPYRGKPASDGPRYKALGNSMAVPVMAWIGQRIEAVEALTNQACAA